VRDDLPLQALDPVSRATTVLAQLSEGLTCLRGKSLALLTIDPAWVILSYAA
jgi:hypothetical protein